MSKPAPIPDQVSAFFWEGAARGELLVQHCADCGSFQYPPTVVCEKCQSRDIQPTRVSGQGTLYALTVMHQAFLPRVNSRHGRIEKGSRDEAVAGNPRHRRHHVGVLPVRGRNPGELGRQCRARRKPRVTGPDAALRGRVGRAGGTLSLVSPPVMFDSEPARATRAPEFGEHTDEVLAAAGYPAEVITKLRESGVVA